MNPIIIKNFMSQPDIETFISYIDKYHLFFSREAGGKVFTKRLGRDNHFKSFSIDTNSLDPIRDLIKLYAGKLIKECSSQFLDHSDLFLNQFWLVKRFPGVGQTVHTDVDGGDNSQLKYSGIIYLNTIPDSGDIFFPEIGFNYYPVAGDLVLFKSDDPDLAHGVNETMETRYTLPIWITDDIEYALIK